ncbi:MAG TPA: hypothetical protein VFO30_08035, partial [Chthoniobacterales bacterium]|nr:hypothetical protein [Chthoniobacterales bacterium]
LGDYAEKNGNIDIAEAAYTNAAIVAPKLRIAQQGRLRIAQRKPDTRKLHSILAEMLAIWPNDSAVQNDEAYTRLLLLMPEQQSREVGDQPSPSSGEPGNREPPASNEELERTEQLAEQLIKRDPASLPHLTLLALARLRQGRVEDALRVYENIQVAPNALTPSALAVHAAVLEATGHHQDAQSELDKIKPDQLLPEEQALIEKAEKPKD